METKENIEIYSALKTAPVNYDHQYYSQELFLEFTQLKIIAKKSV